MQLLWINLVTDSLPAIALGMEGAEKDIMKRKPRSKDESLFAGGYALQIFMQGAMFALLTLTGFILVWRASGDLTAGRTTAFLVLSLTQVFHAFNMRSDRSIFEVGILTNRALCGAAVLSVVMILLVALVPPLALAFGLTFLTAGQYALALGLSRSHQFL